VNELAASGERIADALAKAVTDAHHLSDAISEMRGKVNESGPRTALADSQQELTEARVAPSAAASHVGRAANLISALAQSTTPTT
jgi:hypothetical protein